ncbi:hypothetical protein NQ318_020577 [Aromia moschata]|uniref:Pre-rRNA-processing protein TSR2 homolog n=1 Tax=Aromia moschata TaxID=1265417 RepID=A0AAV8Z293_9CUCU|nr:hypothetical protein NQ318_020577 [Aromia moschata]
MEDAFAKVVQQIFNNWTALKLAVEHSMGGPNSRQTAVDCVNYMVQYCLYEPNIDPENIQEALEDILDEEFETVCEDGSPKEIASILYKFIQLLKDGNMEQCELEYQKLPVLNFGMIVEDSSSSEEENNSETHMEDDGWVEVKSKRKR